MIPRIWNGIDDRKIVDFVFSLHGHGVLWTDIYDTPNQRAICLDNCTWKTLFGIKLQRGILRRVRHERQRQCRLQTQGAIDLHLFVLASTDNSNLLVPPDTKDLNTITMTFGGTRVSLAMYGVHALALLALARPSARCDIPQVPDLNCTVVRT